MASTIRELRAAGFISRQAMADELNRRKIPTARGGRWQYTTVLRMLTRLGLRISGKGGRINNGQESKRAAMREPRHWLRQFETFRRKASSLRMPSRES
jgi:hypothetical protein